MKKSMHIFICIPKAQPKLHNCFLKILLKLLGSPFPSDLLEPYILTIFNYLIDIVRKDNKHRAILALKIISNIVQNGYRTLIRKLPSFFKLARELFTGLERMVTEQLDSALPTGVSEGSTPLESAATDSGHQAGLEGKKSFKVPSKCLTVVIAILKVYKLQAIKSLPLIEWVLRRQTNAQKQGHEEGVTIKNRARFDEFITVQVKTLHLLAYLLKSFPNLLALIILSTFLASSSRS